MMKRTIVALMALLLSAPAFANSDLAIEIANSHLQSAVELQIRTMNAINWRVGERAEYKLSATMGNLGDMKKWVDREDGNAIWVNTEVTGQMQQKIEAKLDRATGQMLEYIENGVRKTPPTQNLEIVSQDEQRVTVPAGTFDTIHVVAKTDNAQVRQIEVWMNPRDTVMEGMVQTKLTTSFMPVMIQMVRFSHP